MLCLFVTEAEAAKQQGEITKFILLFQHGTQVLVLCLSVAEAEAAKQQGEIAKFILLFSMEHKF